VVPCCVFDDCPDDKTAQTEKHESGDEDCGTCSPFFNCNGCAVATIAYHPVFSLPKIAPQKITYSTFIYTLYPDPSVEFWQPPKIG
jgi:sulfatase maturation enzyme AslB (radical SAM superfamily)